MMLVIINDIKKILLIDFFFLFLQILTEELDENIIPQLYTQQLQLTDGIYGTINQDKQVQQFKTKSSSIILLLLHI